MDSASAVASPSSLVTPTRRMEHDLFHKSFLSAFQQNFAGILVCNARKWEHSRKTAINFLSDVLLGLVFLYLNENDKNYAIGGEFSWFDLPKKFQNKQRGFQDLNSPMVWTRFCRHISFIGSETYGADRTWSLAFSYCLVSIEHDLAHGAFLSSFQQNFPGLLVCNARKQEQPHKTVVNFAFDGRLGPVFLCWNENDKN